MVVLPAGRFPMGSPSDEGGREDVEGPVHEVSIRRFAMGKFPVTKGEFAAFVTATGYQTDAEKNTAVPGVDGAAGCSAYKGGTDFGYTAGTSWRNPGFSQDDNHPVVCLSWNDAQAYAQWLANKTGKRYRLPTEAEMEWAIRAGSTSPYPWGSDPGPACRYGNLADASVRAKFPEWHYPTASCNDSYVYTSPVGHYDANRFGLHDTVGDVWTWTQDCFHDSYDGAPGDGSAQQSSNTIMSAVFNRHLDCGDRVMRGGAWETQPVKLRSAHRYAQSSAYRYYSFGLRVAQDL
jgi:formylglycine-generating enzyme required for sulfatase activity